MYWLSADSIASDTSLTTMPRSNRNRVTRPGRVPTPTIATRTVAYTRSGTARLMLTIVRTNWRVNRLGLLGRAAHNVRGIETAAANAAPAIAIAKVSNIGANVRGRKAKFGWSSCFIFVARSEEHTSELQSR